MFDRPRRRRRSNSRRDPSSRREADPNAPASQPWIAVSVDELIEGAIGPQAAVEPPRPKPAAPPSPTYSRYAVLPAVLFVGAASIFVIQGSLRSALAEAWIGESSLVSLKRAVAAMPDRSLAWLRLGMRQSRDGESDSALRSLQMSVEGAPTASSPRIALALELERVGRFDEAESELLKAAASEAGFRPRWNLANHYARRGSWDQVWRWTHESILADPGQLAAAASLGWRAEADPAAILNLAIPDEPGINRRYFAYLNDLGQMEAMRQAWPRFSADVTESEAELATRYVDRLIGAGYVDEAVAAWNHLCDRALLPYAGLRGTDQRFLTNPFFLTDPSGRGFDWTAHDNRGVLWTRPPIQGNRGMIDFRLSGAQESGITLLTQVIPVVPGTYALRFDFATQGMPIRTGLGWVVRDLYSGEDVHPFATLNNAEGFWDAQEIIFAVPRGIRAAVLELRYVEIESKARRLGGFALRDMRLSLAEASEASAP
jgi:tetratricopeptide (TPR) repeat protein